MLMYVPNDKYMLDCLLVYHAQHAYIHAYIHSFFTCTCNMHILYTCNMNLISELFNEHVSSLPHKNTDPTFIHAWSEKNM